MRKHEILYVADDFGGGEYWVIYKDDNDSRWFVFQRGLSKKSAELIIIGLGEENS